MVVDIGLYKKYGVESTNMYRLDGLRNNEDPAVTYVEFPEI